MGTVFLLHFNAPYQHARHYLEYTARTVEARVSDHRAGFAYRTVPLMLALHQSGITFDVARVWPNASKADEKRLRDLHDNPRLCPVCNPALRLRTKRYTRTSAPHDYTGEIYTHTYWRTYGNPRAYGNLDDVRTRPIKRRKPRIRRDGTLSYVPLGDDVAGVDATGAPFVVLPAPVDYVVINGRPYDIDILMTPDEEIPF